MIKIALVGNPNSGKSTIFNLLTKSRQKIANYPGVTIEKKEGFCRFSSQNFYFIDLPGIYSLTSHSKEELIARDYIVDEKPDIVVNVIDSSNIERSLYLTTQLMELNCPIVLVCNKMDLARAHGVKIDSQQLSSYLEAFVVNTIASKKEGIEDILKAILKISFKKEKSNGIFLKFSKEIEDSIEKIKESLKEDKKARWHAIKLLENDESVEDKIFSEDSILIAKKEREGLENFFKISLEEKISFERDSFLEKLSKKMIERTFKDISFFSDKLDKVFTNKFLGLPIFFIFIYIIFNMTFFLGSFVSKYIEIFFKNFSYLVSSLWQKDDIIRALLTDGVINGVGSVIVFLPTILFLFFFLAILEETGYMARACFVMDKIMHKIGLHGKSFIPLLLGFGCSVPAIMSTRILENKKDRFVVILAIPFISCSAKLAVFTLIIPAFFSFKISALILFGLYLLGIVFAVFFMKILKKSLFKSETIPFIMELPPYQMPSYRNIFKDIFFKATLYLKKAGTLILLISIIFWFLSAFPKNKFFSEEFNKNFSILQNETKEELKKTNAIHQDFLKEFETQTKKVKFVNNFELDFSKNKNLKDYLKENLEKKESVEKIEERFNSKAYKLKAKKRKNILYNSYISKIGHAIEPIFRPLGFDWKLDTALLGALSAKEAFISQLSIIFSVESEKKTDVLQKILNKNYSSLVAISILLFILISTPCFATILMTRKETKSFLFAIFQFFFFSFFAYIIAFATYKIGSLFV